MDRKIDNQKSQTKLTGYKMTELGPLPQEWEVARLGEVVKKIVSGDWGSSEKSNDNFIKCYVLRGTDFKKCEDKIINDVPIRFVLKNSLEKRRLKAGDILIELSGGGPGQPTGRIFFVTEDFIKKIGENVVFSNFVKKLIADESIIQSEFFYRYWQFLYQRGKTLVYEKRTTGIRNFKYNDFLKQENILIPQLEEQRKIAAILSTVQKAIETEKALIERTKELKKSMMHKLFTEGIGWLSGAETSQKQTEIGPIPKNWEVVRLGEEIVDIIMGQSPPGETYNTDGNGFPFLQGKAEFGYKHPKNIKYTTKPQKIAPKNSILLSVRAPVGDVNIADKEYCIGRGLAAINGKQGNNYFIFYYLLYNKNNIERLGSGSTFKSINKSQIENLKIPLPPLPEQQQIADILSTIDQKIEHHTTKKQKLEELFRTLLHELMTARVRVNEVELKEVIK